MRLVVLLLCCGALLTIPAGAYAGSCSSVNGRTGYFTRAISAPASACTRVRTELRRWLNDPAIPTKLRGPRGWSCTRGAASGGERRYRCRTRGATVTFRLGYRP